jgi:hypothetical protein
MKNGCNGAASAVMLSTYTSATVYGVPNFGVVLYCGREATVVFLVLLSLLPVTYRNGELHPARQERNCGQSNASTLTSWLPPARQQLAVAMSPAGLQHTQSAN